MSSTNQGGTTASLLDDLRHFIQETTVVPPPSTVPLVRTALNLLQHLPAAHNAIFEYFNCLFETLAFAHYTRRKSPKASTGTAVGQQDEEEETVLLAIRTCLIDLINRQPTTWSTLISTWSFALLGTISARHSGGQQQCRHLGEILSFWLECPATSTLVAVNTRCVSGLMRTAKEEVAGSACISALLDTSVQYSPHFDWVVAYVGRCCPHVVITRVLECGLHDFLQVKNSETGRDSVRLKSAVGILEHLAGTHRKDVQKAVVDMIQTNLSDDSRRHLPVIAYILQLSLLSPVFYQTVSDDLSVYNLTPPTIDMLLARHLDELLRYFGSQEALIDIAVTLIIDSIQGVTFIQAVVAFHKHCRRQITSLLNAIMERTDALIRHDPMQSVRMLDSLDDVTINVLVDNILTSTAANDDECQMAVHLLLFWGCSCNGGLQRFIAHVICAILERAQTAHHLRILLAMATHELLPVAAEGGEERDVLSVALAQCLCAPQAKLWPNLYKLLRWEQCTSTASYYALKMQPVTRAIRANFTAIVQQFKQQSCPDDDDVIAAICVASLETCVRICALDTCQVMATATVRYFLRCCQRLSVMALKSFRLAGDILRFVCGPGCVHAKSMRVFCVRALLEAVLLMHDSSNCQLLFSSSVNVKPLTVPGSAKPVDGSLLLEENRKTAPSRMSSGWSLRSHYYSTKMPDDFSSVQHRDGYLPVEQVKRNVRELVNLLRAVCIKPIAPAATDTNGISLETVTIISLQLVQLISPDVMYNGLPWPDEEFNKVTVERDLAIWRRFIGGSGGSTSILWPILEFVAVHRPALCYCSVLLRALVATLIHQWRTSADRQRPLLNATTVRLLDLMTLGQLLPPPLASLRLVIGHLRPSEIVEVLRDCVWCFLRDHIPSPALFITDLTTGRYWRDPVGARPAPAYTNTLRVIMQRNIEQVGHLYAQMFIRVQ